MFVQLFIIENACVVKIPNRFFVKIKEYSQNFLHIVTCLETFFQSTYKRSNKMVMTIPVVILKFLILNFYVFGPFFQLY